VDRTPTLGVVVGRNVRSLRAERGVSQEEVAEQLRLVGLPWSRAMLHTLEIGRRSLGLVEFALLVRALDVPAARLLRGNDFVLFDDAVFVPVGEIGERGTVRQLWDLVFTTTMRQAEGPVSVPIEGDQPQQLSYSARATGEAERNVARNLGIGVMRLLSYSAVLWGRSLTSERDARVAERVADENPSRRTLQALRGHVTRELTTELRGALADEPRLSDQ